MANFFFKILSGFYRIGTSFRNFLYDNHILSSHEFFTPVISVGNITVGGTGKTPHTEYIVDMLKDDFKVTILSRGYKRKTHGYLKADENSTVAQIGDEPKQMYRKFHGKVDMVVDEDRVHGIKKIIQEKADKQIVVLDDAYQHRSVVPRVNILLIDYNRPVHEDNMLPYGRLRESVKGVSRANIVVITKCPDDVKPVDRRILAKNIGLLPCQSIYFTKMKYLNLTKVFQEAVDEPVVTRNTQILLITGIATTNQLEDYVKKTYSENITHVKFQDHHNFKKKDILKITENFTNLSGEDRIIITTEKDSVRLMELDFHQELKKHMYYLPIKVDFVFNDQDELKKQILDYVAKDKTNYRLHTTVRQF